MYIIGSKLFTFQKMVDNEVTYQCKRKQVRQPPSVPFLWEEKPGTPKKDWKPEKMVSVNPLPLIPVKLVASIPFKWEEKPGKPFPSFLHPKGDPPPPPLLLLHPPPANLISFSSPSVQSQQDYNDGNYQNDDVDVDTDDEQDDMFEMDLESFGFETDGSFGSAPSLLANRLLSTVAISNSVPEQKASIETYKKGLPETLSSSPSETGSSTSSYATGTTSLVGASFLECLFPLFPPDSGFLEKVGHSEKGSLHPLEQQQNKDLDCVSNCNVVVRRTPTLGELIMMSRRRSHRMKAVQMRKLTLGFTNKTAFGCWIFGISSNGIERLHGKRRQPRLVSV